jgi:hypothetical protein
MSHSVKDLRGQLPRSSSRHFEYHMTAAILDGGAALSA